MERWNVCKIVIMGEVLWLIGRAEITKFNSVVLEARARGLCLGRRDRGYGIEDVGVEGGGVMFAVDSMSNMVTLDIG